MPIRKTRHLAATACTAAALVAGCASAPPSEAPKLERLTGAALEAKLPAPLAKVGLDEIVAMSRRGESAAAIVAEIDASHSRYRLTATQIIDLAQKGVAREVLDHLVAAERQGIFDDMAADIGRRDRACVEQIERELRQCRLQSMAPFWPAQPFATCWPPHAGFPYWRCF